MRGPEGAGLDRLQADRPVGAAGARRADDVEFDLAAQRVPQGEWAPRLGTGSDFVVRKTAEQARRFAPEAVRALYRLLLEADVAMKTGETTEELALTELLAQAGSLRVAARGSRW